MLLDLMLLLMMTLALGYLVALVFMVRFVLRAWQCMGRWLELNPPRRFTPREQIMDLTDDLGVRQGPGSPRPLTRPGPPAAPPRGPP